MQDGIIAGNGNSRYLKTVAEALSLYPTYQDFIAALIPGTFPIDLNPINAAGWVHQGTALNKANLLADVTASSIGLGGDATPNSAFANLQSKIKNLSSAKSEVVPGSYTGNGTLPRTINLGFTPKAIFVIGYKGSGFDPGSSGDNYSAVAGTGIDAGKSFTCLQVATNGFTVQHSDYGGQSHMNTNDMIYNYIAFK